MTQTILNFNLATTNEKLTPRAGTIIFGEYIKGLGLENLCNLNLPQSKSNRGFEQFNFIYGLVLMLHSGGRFIEDIKKINSDKALRETLKIKNLPTSTTILKWLKRTGLMGVYGLQTINKQLIKRYLKNINEDLILDISYTNKEDIDNNDIKNMLKTSSSNNTIELIKNSISKQISDS